MELDLERAGFAARLNEALDDIGMPPKGKGRQVEVGKRWGVSQKAARKWLEGEGFPEMDTAIRLARDTNVMFEWLMTGRGPKRTTDMEAERAMSQMPEDIVIEAVDYMRFKVQRTMSGDQLGRYLQWLDRIVALRKGSA